LRSRARKVSLCSQPELHVFVDPALHLRRSHAQRDLGGELAPHLRAVHLLSHFFVDVHFPLLL